ncbi:MAG: SusD/RagB family nutrient-binding outer membrane lipoprotein [Bacteroidia bacterium]
MKSKHLSLLAALLLGCLLPACDAGFAELNVDPTRTNSINPAFLLSNAQLGSSFGGHTIIYESAIVQHTMHPFLGVLAGGNVNQRNDNNTQGNWNQYYPGTIKLLTDIVAQTQDDPARSNLYHMARIWRVYIFAILTDSYGDVPYTQAGLGFLESVTLPTYDAQEAIYSSLLTELEQATAGLDAGKATERADLFYQGDIVRWKRLGYSLMLRLGMRLVKANPSLAQTTVQKAFAGGVMESNADNCVMAHSVTYQNPTTNLFTGTERANFYLHQTLVSFLQGRDDPRLGAIAVLYGNPGLTPTDPAQTENADPAAQIGMPMGYDNITLLNAPDFPGAAGSGYNYSQINRRTLTKIDAPCFHVTHAQTQLLLAEAAARGWITGQSQDYYRAGIRAHMEQLADYDAGAAIDAGAIDAFVGAASLPAGGEIEEINTQYWVACLLNGPEAFANWRRSGFPALAANPYPAKDIAGDFIRRMNYPAAERAVNTANYDAAVARQGSDELDARVWWDK